MKPSNKYYRLNQNITAPQVRVIDESGKQIGILSREQALQEAVSREVDLVEVAPQAKPSVCRLIDFKKFKYLESKKAKQEKRAKVEVKEIRLGPFISENDLQVRLRKARDFLKDGDRVRAVVKFTGRQMAHTEFGQKLIERFMGELADISKVEREPRFEGRLLVAGLTPTKIKG